ncbi:4-hydroxy-L-threonine phosphate dehydrogenase PdxA [Bradyrhizobium sp. LM3.6]
MARQPAKPLALTLGEPAGIGPDIAIAAWLKRRELDLPAFYLLGDEALIARRAEALGADVRIASVSASGALSVFAEALPVVATGEPASAEPGKPDASSAHGRARLDPPGGH